MMVVAVTAEAAQPWPTGQSTEPLTLWTSADQVSWKPAELKSMTGGGLYPELLLLTKATPSRSGPDAGEVLLYLTNESGCTCARSVDQGRTWGESAAVTINGLPTELKGKSLGPLSAVQLEDGRVRVYFAEDHQPARPANPFVRPPADPRPLAPTIPDMPKPPPGSPGRSTLPPSGPAEETPPGRTLAGPKATVVRSAISNDGLRFAVEDGVRFELAGAGSPEVIRLPADSRDGQGLRIGPWLMFLNRGGSIVLAHSKDGLTWTRDETFAWDDVEHADAAVAKGGSPGSVRVMAVRNKKVVSGVFDPATGAVTEDAGLRLPDNGQDASACPLGDGTFLLIRRQRAADKTVTPPDRPGLPVRPPTAPRSP